MGLRKPKALESSPISPGDEVKRVRKKVDLAGSGRRTSATKGQVILLGLGTRTHEGFRIWVKSKRKPQISPLRYPGFPVDIGGVGELHAAFLTESRTRGRFQCSAAGNQGTLRSR